MIWICNVLVLNLYLYFSFNNILDLYLDLLILYQKAKGPKIIKVFFGKIKNLSKTSPKPKLKSGYKTVGYKHNNR